jgi:gliding motility-associated-like protein
VELCQGTQYTIMAASISNFSGILWTHDGAGTLIQENTLIPTYIPSAQDTGIITLTLHALPLLPCAGDSSAMQINYLPQPEVNAGTDQQSCASGPVLITGSTSSGTSSLLWTTSGDGFFSNPAVLHPTYAPGNNDLSVGVVQLTLTGAGIPPCETAISQKALTFSRSPAAFAGNDSSICEGDQYTLTEASATNYHSIAWTTSGEGYFSDRYNLSSVYVPGEKDILAGSVWLYLHAYASGPCPPSVDSLRLLISPAPRAYAGVDDTICQGGSYYVTGTTAENYSSILWTHNGQGTLTGETTLNPTYISAPNETGYSNLKMSVYGKGNCSEIVATDKRRIIINQTVAANAGPDQEIPYDTSIVINGNAQGGSGEYHYSWSPADYLTDSDTEHPKTINLLNDQTFVFYVTDLFTGCSSSDEVFIKVNPKKPDDSECLNIYNVITPNGDGFNDTWVIDCIESHPENRVEIFDRWGDIIQTFENYNNNTMVWKGTNRNNNTVPDGTYYYILTLKSGDVYKGWVLVR